MSEIHISIILAGLVGEQYRQQMEVIRNSINYPARLAAEQHKRQMEVARNSLGLVGEQYRQQMEDIRNNMSPFGERHKQQMEDICSSRNLKRLSNIIRRRRVLIFITTENHTPSEPIDKKKLH